MQKLESSLKRCINFWHRTLNSFYAFKPEQNAPCVSLKKWCFKEWKCTLNSSSASWVAQNASCVRLKKRCFRGFEIWTLKYKLKTSKVKVHSSRSKVKGERSNLKPLKHSFFNLTQVAIWASQEAENKFKVHFHSLKHRYFRFRHGAFCAGLKA